MNGEAFALSTSFVLFKDVCAREAHSSSLFSFFDHEGTGNFPPFSVALWGWGGFGARSSFGLPDWKGDHLLLARLFFSLSSSFFCGVLLCVWERNVLGSFLSPPFLR